MVFLTLFILDKNLFFVKSKSPALIDISTGLKTSETGIQAENFDPERDLSTYFLQSKNLPFPPRVKGQVPYFTIPGQLPSPGALLGQSGTTLPTFASIPKEIPVNLSILAPPS